MAKKSKYKTMMVREEVWRKLDKLKRAGESYSDLLARLCDIAVEVDNAGGITSKFTRDLMAAINRLAQERITESQQGQVSPPSEDPPKRKSDKPKKKSDEEVADEAFKGMLDAFDNPPKF